MSTSITAELRTNSKKPTSNSVVSIFFNKMFSLSLIACRIINLLFYLGVIFFIQTSFSLVTLKVKLVIADIHNYFKGDGGVMCNVNNFLEITKFLTISEHNLLVMTIKYQPICQMAVRKGFCDIQYSELLILYLIYL